MNRITPVLSERIVQRMARSVLASISLAASICSTGCVGPYIRTPEVGALDTFSLPGKSSGAEAAANAATGCSSSTELGADPVEVAFPIRVRSARSRCCREINVVACGEATVCLCATTKTRSAPAARCRRRSAKITTAGRTNPRPQHQRFPLRALSTSAARLRRSVGLRQSSSRIGWPRSTR